MYGALLSAVWALSIVRAIEGPCTTAQTTCVTSSKCIPKVWACDGIRDCPDGSDELECGSPSQINDIRLVGGTTKGRLEVKYNGEWRPMCAEYFDNNAAKVACTQLGFPNRVATIQHYYDYAEGTRRINLKGLSCVGTEASLNECERIRHYYEYCYMPVDAGVICETCLPSYDGINCEIKPICAITCVTSGKCISKSLKCDGIRDCPDGSDELECGGQSQITDIRLVNGTSSLNGRLEVFYKSEWGTVCDNYFDVNDASVVCTQLGHPNRGPIARRLAYYGKGTGKVHLRDLSCVGTEASLNECERIRHYYEYCFHRDDAGVDCEFSFDPSAVFVRLVGGATPNQGRVEVIYRDVVGTICGNNWDDNDAQVICSMMGYHGTGSRATDNDAFGQGDDVIWVDAVNCVGTETSIADCPTTNGWNDHTCTHEKDVGVICSTEQPLDKFLLLTDSVNDKIFRMDLTTFAHYEIPHDTHIVMPGAIGYDDIEQKVYWTDVGTQRLKQSNLDGSNIESLGYLAPYTRAEALAIDPISRNLFFTDASANVFCMTSLESFGLMPITTLPISTSERIRPRGIALHPAKGYIFWTSASGKIERANMDGTDRITLISSYGKYRGITIDYAADCIYWFDAYAKEIVKADLDGQMREKIAMYTKDVIGLVMVDEYIYYTDSKTSSLMRVNKDGENRTSVGPATFGRLTGIVAYTSGVGIYGLSPNDCTSNTGGCSHICVPMPDLAIACLCPDNMELDTDGKNCILTEDFPIQLIGVTELEGRLDVKYAGVWGTVCNDYFDDNTAKVICAQLGHPNPAATAWGIGIGGDRVNFENVRCTGTETSLNECASLRYPNIKCRRNDHAVWVDCDFSLDPSIVFVRLVGGITANQGRVEVIYRDVVGTICGNNWDDNDAQVICSMLGYQRAGSQAAAKGAFGQGGGRIWVDDVNCVGIEDSIAVCPTTNGWIVHTCTHEEDAGVICSTDTPPDNFILVTDSGHESIFRMDLSTFAHTEIRHDDNEPRAIEYDHINQKMYWFDGFSKQIKTSKLDGSNAEIFGYLNPYSIPDELAIDPISRNLFFRYADTIQVTSLEEFDPMIIVTGRRVQQIALHPSRGYIFWTESLRWIERANMDGTGQLTLIYRSSTDISIFSTILGIAIDYSDNMIYWADDSKNTLEKADFEGRNREKIASRSMLGIVLVDDYIYYTDKNKYVMRITKNGEHNERVGPDTFANIEKITAYTADKGIYALTSNDCSQNRGGCSRACVPMPGGIITCICPVTMRLDDDGKKCVRDKGITDIRLVGGMDSKRGRLEVKYNARWGTVCDYHFNDDAAKVVCAELGYINTVAIAVDRSSFGEGRERINIADIYCDGSEPSLDECELSLFPEPYCLHGREAGVDCDFLPDASMSVRLVQRHFLDYDGRVELIYGNSLGSICGNNWDDNDAQVICAMWGFERTGSRASMKGEFGRGYGRIWVDQVNCIGNETSIVDCPTTNGWMVHTCSQEDAAGVICSTKRSVTDVRLVGGADSKEGRLEVERRGKWGTVRGTGFNDAAARIVCAQLGYPNPAATAWGSAYFGEGTDRVLVDRVHCNDTHTSLSECKVYLSNGYPHSDDVGVDCDFSPDASTVFVRLTGGPTANQGRVEVEYRDVKGTICGHNWDDNDAMVICSMLGYQRTGSQAAAKGAFGQGVGRIWVDDVNCVGTEDFIADCPTTNGWIVHTCTHEDAAGVICSTESQPDNFILMTGGWGSRIHRIDLSTFAQTEIFPDGVLASVGIGYDHITQQVYWAADAGQFKKSDLDGSSYTHLAKTEARIRDIAVDPISRNMFITDWVANTISVTNIDVFKIISIIDTNLDTPDGIALHPAKGYIFWTDSGQAKRTIERANMDGTGRIIIISSDTERPTGITIDYSDEMIYWVDDGTHTIEKADFNGEKREVIHKVSNSMRGLALVADYIYYTESHVMRVNKNGGGNVQVGMALSGATPEMIAYTPGEGIYTLRKNDCSDNRGGCSHTCVPLPNEAIKCLCPDAMALHVNGKTCVTTVDGEWTDWSIWNCDVTCGTGVATRSRSCTITPPQNGGTGCSGDSTEIESCTRGNCPAGNDCSDNGGGCSHTCVTLPNAVIECLCPNGMTLDVNGKTCVTPVDGEWTDWSIWNCDVTCGTGMATRSRSCTHPPPLNGGADCSGDSIETESCTRGNCPVDGAWAAWSAWTCDVTCGSGISSRQRGCTDPQPQYGGFACPGENTDTKTCSRAPCRVDGGWAAWSAWTCGVTCGSGISSRQRDCTDPEPQYDGLTCLGTNTEFKTCSLATCRVDGAWAVWSAWTCDVTCGSGISSRQRGCTDPEPQYGGLTCLGANTDIKTCSLAPCRVDGAWAAWSAWICGVTCGSGISYRQRSCTDPEPQFGGLKCPGANSDINTCSLAPCRVNGAWAAWGAWTCDVTCGNGISSRQRGCTDPEPQYDGLTCPGANRDTKTCSFAPCTDKAVDGEWTDWSIWNCDVTCGTGVAIRGRSCTNPPPQNGGAGCSGDSIETDSCTRGNCPVDGAWAAWGAWTCDVTCGSGISSRQRGCTYPEPQSGGLTCPGANTDTKTCSFAPCQDTPPENFIFVTDSFGPNIYRMDLPTFVQTEIPHGNTLMPMAIGYDHIDQKVYWSDLWTNELTRSSLDGSNFEIVADLGSYTIPDGLAIDPIFRNLFFTDAGTNTISVTSLDVFELISIITMDLDQPRGIALHPAEGYIFWTDWGRFARIERANMDGTDRLPLITSGIRYPNGIAIDFMYNEIYWADAYTHNIEKADFNGQNRVLIYRGTGHIFSLVLVADYIYYTDWTESSVMRINKDGTDNIGVGPSTFEMLSGITAFTPAEGIYILSAAANSCSVNRGGCSHTCVPLPNEASKCLCPSGMALEEKGKTCA